MPLVSVVTPVYNGERYLAACIESVLSQSFRDFEYVIVDNCSTDRTSSLIAQYAKDSRIRVHRNPELLPVIANYNRCAELASVESRYLKYVAADDLLLPGCIERMVEVAERHPAVQLVASYKIHGDTPVCEGPPFPQEVVDGREVCRWFYLGKLGVLGGPTNHLIRRGSNATDEPLFDETFLHADIEYFVRLLKDGASYGFVHQVLTFTREHETSVSTKFADVMGTRTSEFLAILMRHGGAFFPAAEHQVLVKAYKRMYARYLVRALLKPWNPQIFQYQNKVREKFGLRIGTFDLMEAAVREAAASIAAPSETLRRLGRERARATGQH